MDLSVKQFAIDKWLCLYVQRNLLPSFLIQPQLVWLLFFLFSIIWLYMTSFILSIHFWNYFYFIWYLFSQLVLFHYICFNYSNCIFNLTSCFHAIAVLLYNSSYCIVHNTKNASALSGISTFQNTDGFRFYCSFACTAFT